MRVSADVCTHKLGVRNHRKLVMGITFLEKVWGRKGNAEDEGRSYFSFHSLGTIEFSNLAYMSFPFF